MGSGMSAWVIPTEDEVIIVLHAGYVRLRADHLPERYTRNCDLSS